MAGAFQLLRSNDLVWSRIVREYLMGERTPTTDLMAWNAGATRTPYRMHSEYLRQLFLNNDLAEGRFKVEGQPVAVSDIRAPIFAVRMERDHVAPWCSAFKIHLLADADVTFLLTAGGHNAGIVSDPDRPGRSFGIPTKSARDRYLDPDSWLYTLTPVEATITACSVTAAMLSCWIGTEMYRSSLVGPAGTLRSAPQCLSGGTTNGHAQ